MRRNYDNFDSIWEALDHSILAYNFYAQSVNWIDPFMEDLRHKKHDTRMIFQRILKTEKNGKPLERNFVISETNKQNIGKRGAFYRPEPGEIQFIDIPRRFLNNNAQFVFHHKNFDAQNYVPGKQNFYPIYTLLGITNSNPVGRKTLMGYVYVDGSSPNNAKTVYVVFRGSRSGTLGASDMMKYLISEKGNTDWVTDVSDMPFIKCSQPAQNGITNQSVDIWGQRITYDEIFNSIILNDPTRPNMFDKNKQNLLGIHIGMGAACVAAQRSILIALNTIRAKGNIKFEEVKVTGHSLGGGLATLTSIWLKELLSNNNNFIGLSADVHCYAFSAPTVFRTSDNNWQSESGMKSAYKDLITHVATSGDAVTSGFQASSFFLVGDDKYRAMKQIKVGPYAEQNPHEPLCVYMSLVHQFGQNQSNLGDPLKLLPWHKGKNISDLLNNMMTYTGNFDQNDDMNDVHQARVTAELLKQFPYSNLTETYQSIASSVVFNTYQVDPTTFGNFGTIYQQCQTIQQTINSGNLTTAAQLIMKLPNPPTKNDMPQQAKEAMKKFPTSNNQWTKAQRGVMGQYENHFMGHLKFRLFRTKSEYGKRMAYQLMNMLDGPIKLIKEAAFTFLNSWHYASTKLESKLTRFLPTAGDQPSSVYHRNQ